MECTLPGHEIRDVISEATGGWTPELVFMRLCNAVKVAQVCVKRPGPSNKMIATMEIRPEKTQDEAITITRRKTATPAEVSLMEEALLWVEKHVLDERARLMLGALARSRALGGNFRRVCKSKGWGKSHAYETININLRAVAGALNRAKVPVRL